MLAAELGGLEIMVNVNVIAAYVDFIRRGVLKKRGLMQKSVGQRQFFFVDKEVNTGVLA